MVRLQFPLSIVIHPCCCSFYFSKLMAELMLLGHTVRFNWWYFFMILNYFRSFTLSSSSSVPFIWRLPRFSFIYHHHYYLEIFWMKFYLAHARCDDTHFVNSCALSSFGEWNSFRDTCHTFIHRTNQERKKTHEIMIIKSIFIKH